MDQSGTFTRDIGPRNLSQWALLIDGENVASTYSATILGKNAEVYAIRRVYGDAAKLNGWARIPELRVIHTPEGRNSADILLAIDALTLASTGTRDFTIVTADGGLVHLVRHLRETGCRVVVVADDRASAGLRSSGHGFVNLLNGSDVTSNQVLPSAPPLMAGDGVAMERGIVAFVAASKDEGVTVAAINKFARAAYPDCPDVRGDVRQWLQWLSARSDVFRVDPPGTTARVRLVSYAPSPTP